MAPQSNAVRPDFRVGGTAILGALVLALGVFVTYQAQTGQSVTTYARVGPSFFPTVVGGASIIVGICLLIQALRGQWTMQLIEAAEDGADKDLSAVWRVALVIGGLLANWLLMGPLGFILASATMFTMTTRAFGSKKILANALVGLAFAGVIYLIFRFGLRINLPTGGLWS